MNFITDLLTFKKSKKKYDAIFVIINRFTKMSLYILTRKSLKAFNLTNLIINAITIRIKLLKLIVNNREPVFTSLF
jgi:hypothetical protein